MSGTKDKWFDKILKMSGEERILYMAKISKSQELNRRHREAASKARCLLKNKHEEEIATMARYFYHLGK